MISPLKPPLTSGIVHGPPRLMTPEGRCGKATRNVDPVDRWGNRSLSIFILLIYWRVQNWTWSCGWFNPYQLQDVANIHTLNQSLDILGQYMFKSD